MRLKRIFDAVRERDGQEMVPHDQQQQFENYHGLHPEEAATPNFRESPIFDGTESSSTQGDSDRDAPTLHMLLEEVNPRKLPWRQEGEGVARQAPHFFL